MTYAITCTDKPDHLQLRMDTRPAHVDYLNALNADGKLVLAGPTLDTNDKPNGSIVIVKADSLDEAQAIADNDPYAKAGLFARVDVQGWRWVFNKPEA